MQVTRLGEELGVILPDSLVEMLGLKEGDEVEINVAVPMESEVDREKRRAEALRRLRDIRATLPPGYKFDREEANAR